MDISLKQEKFDLYLAREELKRFSFFAQKKWTILGVKIKSKWMMELCM